MPGDLTEGPVPAARSRAATLEALSRTVLDVLWQDSDAAMVVVGPDGLIREMNPVARASGEAIGLRTGDRIAAGAVEVWSVDRDMPCPPPDRPLERALAGRSSGKETMFVRFHGDLDMRRMVISAEPIGLDDGERGALLIWRDVTDSWQQSERSRNELDRLGALVEGASDYAIIMLDSYGKVTSWSAPAERVHGYPESEVIGLPYAAFFDEADRAAGLPNEILTSAVARGKVTVEGKRVRRDGSVFWAHASLTALREDDGRLRGFVKVTQDVSERRAIERAVVQLNDELRELNEQLEERVAERTVQLHQQAADLAAVNAELEAFSYSVSHDLRAPLRAMNGFAKIIQTEYGEQLPPEALRYLGKVTENAQQMGNLIDALLAFSRMQRQTLRTETIEMTELVQECWTILAPSRAGREIEFVLGDLPPAEGDRRLIRQVWANLLDNAIKYTARTPNARVEVEAHGDPVLYRVKDNGAGFDMRYVGKIGQVFQRLHHAEDFPGTGIGLALVQRIVQRHGGRLSAVGQPAGGATVGFTLRGAL
jgi:PAS domain S-box-containing protein